VKDVNILIDEHLLPFFFLSDTCDGVSWKIVSCQQQRVWKSARSLFFCSWLLGDCHLLKNEAK